MVKINANKRAHAPIETSHCGVFEAPPKAGEIIHNQPIESSVIVPSSETVWYTISTRAASRNQPCLIISVKRFVALLDDTFFKVFCKIGTDLFRGTFHCYLRHVAVYHDLDQLFERGSLRIPS